MNVDYRNLETDILEGRFRENLEQELIDGFRTIRDSGERLPTASHYASQIATIIGLNAPGPLSADLAYGVYQEVLASCEHARATVLSEA